MVSGRDRATYLQGLLTNDIVALSSGQGCYTAYLTAQGRMISDLHVYELGDVMLVTTPRSTKDVMLGKFDQFIFSEDVQLGDVTDAFGVLVLVGPGIARALDTVLGHEASEVAALPLHANRRLVCEGQPVVALRVADTGVPGVALMADTTTMTHLTDAVHAAGGVDLDEETADALRIEAGVPAVGRDIDTETIPLEAGIEERAISFTKGCYVGQEVIIRVLHRGHGRVARKLVGLTLAPHDEVPVVGTALTVDGAVVGSITSSVWSPSLARPIALGYVKRDFVQPGTSVDVGVGVQATVTALPLAASA
jgi:folate-binding protein YgfZ